MSPIQVVWLLGCFNGIGIAIGWFFNNYGALRMLGVCVWVFTLCMYMMHYTFLACS